MDTFSRDFDRVGWEDLTTGAVLVLRCGSYLITVFTAARAKRQDNFSMMDAERNSRAPYLESSRIVVAAQIGK